MVFEKLRSFFEKKDRFAKLLGFDILDIKPGYAKVKAEIKDEFLNGADVAHGGFLFSLADYAFAVASNSRNNLSLAINANIMFSKAVSSGVIFAEAFEIKDGAKVATYEIKITDQKGEILASFSGMVYRKGISII